MLSNQLIALRSSDAVDVMFANPLTGVVVNLILNPNMSLGFWINENLVGSQRVEYKSQGKLNPELSALSCYQYAA